MYWYIKANQMHSNLVREVAGQHPEIRLVDTHPQLDGAHEKFIDLMHFTPEGEQQLAGAFFEGIREILEKDLPRVPP